MGDGKPWHDVPSCLVCKGPGALEPYSIDRWLGPADATLFCLAEGHGWHGSDDEIERALIAEAWWAAWCDSGLSEESFCAAMVEEPEPCTATCFRRGCQHPDRHFGTNAKFCPSRKCFNKGPPCARCAFLKDRHDRRVRQSYEVKP